MGLAEIPTSATLGLKTLVPSPALNLGRDGREVTDAGASVQGQELDSEPCGSLLTQDILHLLQEQTPLQAQGSSPTHHSPATTRAVPKAQLGSAWSHQELRACSKCSDSGQAGISLFPKPPRLGLKAIPPPQPLRGAVLLHLGVV